MIVSIQHKGLKRLWTRDDGSRLPPDQVEKIRDILSLLDSAEKINDMNFPGSALHPLKGDLIGYWSVTVKANWRIVFKFEDGKAYLFDYLDYH
ncbi:MAG: type II toxin-antitoxin system RelE/ParE family toxin [Bacteroidetes bacterium]|nr:type II toxin-antitoxin system RelE/ParE family toxin [Bacteroidota bacterium]